MVLLLIPFFLYVVYPRYARAAVKLWNERSDKTSWYAMQYRDHLRHRISAELNKHYPMIGMIIKVCPLLGLLGTVAGMLEIFDALAATGWLLLPGCPTRPWRVCSWTTRRPASPPILAFCGPATQSCSAMRAGR